MTLKEECAAFRRDAIMRRLYAHGGHRLNTANSLGVTLKTLTVDISALRNAGAHDPAGFLQPIENGFRR